ncbi:hypothetical protein L2E82_32403 [Cichorium intybus]|uniref:Uncharacterized protein n=1 Tax=Cichorium intybus TaxID=13427 RepID=A0ACB9BH48_CICIN|nr:hypothetical protein L2E82_32403 [Cichorium intybus]
MPNRNKIQLYGRCRHFLVGTATAISSFWRYAFKFSEHGIKHDFEVESSHLKFQEISSRPLSKPPKHE